MTKILVIEDDAAIRENTAELLSLEGFEVSTAKNGKQGFAVAMKNNPDVILCDMMMPETDGKGFLALTKSNARLSSIPIIFFSAGTVSPEEQRYLIGASSGFLRKPFLAEDLLAIVKKTMGGEGNRR